MVWFVDEFVHARVVLKTVNPIDGNVVESHIQQGGDGHPGPAVAVHIVVQEAVTADFSQKPGESQDVDKGNCRHGRCDFLAHLIFQEPRVVLQAAIEDEVIRQGTEDEIECGCAELGYQEDRYALAVDVVAGPKRRRCIRGQGVVHIGRVAKAAARVWQGPCVGLVEHEGVEEFERDVHGSQYAPVDVGCTRGCRAQPQRRRYLFEGAVCHLGYQINLIIARKRPEAAGLGRGGLAQPG